MDIFSIMRTTRLFAAACAALVLLAGCRPREMRTATASDEGGLAGMNGTETGLSYDYSVEYVTGGLPAEVRDRINALIIRGLLYDEAAEGMDVPAACARWAEDCKAGYLADIGDLAGEMDEDAGWMYNWSYSVSGAFAGACEARGWRSYRSSASEYTGGAHGMYGDTFYVFDLRDGRTVREEDFLVPGCAEELSALMTDRILAVLEATDAADALLGSPYPNGNFFVDGQGVTWHFNPYEIAPYATGALEAHLSWEELKPFLKKDRI